MDECTEHEELFVLLEQILSHSQILLLALYRVYRARKRRRILLDHVGHRTYSLTARALKQLEILHDIISYIDEICVDYLRMDRNAFGRLCYLLENVEPVPDDSTNDRWKWFKGCLGALDGTQIPIRVPITGLIRYSNRKGDIAVNVLGVCDTNMKFVYILTGWEGFAADSMVLKDVVARVHGLKVLNGISN
ncbi:hypothetical protein BUALT_Bualt02G0040800 [Buddleja alternifolia]|uniref:DDE Tnp4 domain-containing protein n=1 Tax=Buddleja alternifolia TaxID=168488 RepID=A0AAV6Y3Q9_9LAMI|nr:hypothetical protein BUALT_Bualt02G0040800 [Buddleja alternifolia]